MTRAFLHIILLLGTVTHFYGCSEELPSEFTETERMITRLDSIANNVDPLLNEYANRVRVEHLRQRAAPQDEEERITYTGTLATELIRAGETEEAIDKLENLLQDIRNSAPAVRERFEQNIIELLALANLRLGEQENCIINHSAESCLFPIRGEGIHTLTSGSENAIHYYEHLLSEWNPDDYEKRWLLNIAYMTLGQHPDQVPEQWLIPPELFEDGTGFPRFHDVATSVGLADEMALSGGSITEDFNNNGLIDIMTTSWGLSDQLHLYMNNGDGTFTRTTEEAGLTGITGGLNTVQADFNNSGYVDVLVLRGAWLGEAGHHPNSLLRNNGDGTFTDVTESSGILSFHPTQTAVWADFNNNGWLDLFIGNESTPDDPHFSELYLNNKDGTFRNVARQAGVTIDGYVKGVTAGDYTNSGYTDIYISILDGQNLLMRNTGPNDQGVPRFVNMAQRAGVAEPLVSFPAWFWDFNNNGWPDLFVSSYHATAADVAREYLGEPVYAEMPRLYKNNGDGTFTDVTEDTGLNKVMYTMGSNFGDLDNDGYLDFYVGTGDPDLRNLMPNRMFRNISGSEFEEVTASGGFGHLQKGHGVSFADLNNNGQQDIFTVIGGAFEGDVYMNALFENPGNKNNWITLVFEGHENNRTGIGNRVAITIEEADSIRTIHRTVTSGGSFGASTLQLEIGLGSADRIRTLNVYWPASELRQEFSDPEMNRFYRISDTRDELIVEDRTPFQFNGSGDEHDGHTMRSDR